MSNPLVQSMFYPRELASLIKVKRATSKINAANNHSDTDLENLALNLGDRDFCYAVLNKVSRSFAIVIQQLPEQLKDPVCVFYLVLRGLDSVEDDMLYDNSLKIPLLLDFHNKLNAPNAKWNIVDVGDTPDYKILLKYFHKVIAVHQSLDQKYQRVIRDITMKMGAGMAEFAPKIGSLDTVKAYNKYCYYVAGLVGTGLSDLFSASGCEDASLAHEIRLSNSMGLLLQKTNIIRDYLEDCVAGRTWWPEEVWKHYGPSLDSFAKAPDSQNSLDCLNAMVNDALSHVPDSLKYMSLLKDQQVFEFCAIPQTMAMATLALVYNNPDVFKQNVKVRKGLAARMMLESTNMDQVKGWFRRYADQIESKLRSSYPNEAADDKVIAQIKAKAAEQKDRKSLHHDDQVAAWSRQQGSPSTTLALLTMVRDHTGQSSSSSSVVSYAGVAVAVLAGALYLYGGESSANVVTKIFTK